jgi:hypothetical protein
MNGRAVQSGKVFRFVVFLLCLALLTGCEMVHPDATKPLADKDVRAVQTGRKSLVLFRLTTTEARTNESLELTGSVRWNIWRIDDWQHPKPIADSDYNANAPDLHWRIPSVPLGRAGWRYLPLKPGSYLMQVIPDDGYALPYPTYRVSIRKGHPLVYAGSFRFSPGQTFKPTFLDQPKIVSYLPEGVVDERELVPDVASAMPTRPADFITCLPVQNDLWKVPDQFHGRRIIAITASERPPYATEGVGASAATIAGAPLAVPGAFLLDASEGDDKDDSSDDDQGAALTGLGLLIASVPLAKVGDATFGESQRKAWAPHEAALKEELAHINLAQNLTNSLSRLAGTHSSGWTETNAAADLTLAMEVYRCGLKRVGYKYAVEIAVRVSVQNAASRDVLWENGFVYSCWAPQTKNVVLYPYDIDGTPGSERVPFEIPLKARSTTYSLDEFKNQAGRDLFRVELEKGIARLSEGIGDYFERVGFSRTNIPPELLPHEPSLPSSR